MGGNFTIRINKDGTFTYCEGLLSMSYPFVNCFKVDGYDLIFLSENSSNFLYVKVADGERFTNASDKVNKSIF